MKKVKNISGVDLTVYGIGFIEADQEIQVPDDFHNANFEEVRRETKPEPLKEDKPKVDKSNKEQE